MCSAISFSSSGGFSQFQNLITFARSDRAAFLCQLTVQSQQQVTRGERLLVSTRGKQSCQHRKLDLCARDFSSRAQQCERRSKHPCAFITGQLCYELGPERTLQSGVGLRKLHDVAQPPQECAVDICLEIGG